MQKFYCDICGSEIDKKKSSVTYWDKFLFRDLNEHPIEDICPECFWTLFCCVNMMKETGWRPDFHEKLNSESIWDRDRAGYALSKLEGKTGLKLW